MMKDGMIDDWDMFERLAEYTYKKRLHALPEHHPILMSECPWNTRVKREKLLELMFEKFNVPAMYICKNAVLAAYANGRSTAMVVDSGATHTSAVPVHDGYVITQGIVKSPLGGDFLNMQCRQFFEERNVELIPACLVGSKGKLESGNMAQFNYSMVHLSHLFSQSFFIFLTNFSTTNTRFFIFTKFL